MTGLGKNRRRAWVLGLGLGLGLVTFLGAPAASLAEAGRIEPWALVRMPLGDDTGIRRGEVDATQVDTKNRVKGSGTFRGDLERRVFLQAREMLPRARVLRRKIAVDVTVAEEGDIPIAGDFRMGPGPAGLVRLYFVVDRQGSVLGLVDEGGAWVERVKYDVWGAPVFEQADVMPPVVSEVRTDAATRDVVLVMSEPVVPRAVLPAEPMGMVTEAVDLSSEVFFEDDLGQEVPGRVIVDLDAIDEPGVPVGSVLRWIPDSTVLPGTQLVLRLNQRAVVDDGNLGNADTSLAVTYGTGVSYTGPPAGSTQPVLQAQSLTGNRLLFQSHFWDADVGLYHMRARMFDPRSGTFLSRDPSGYIDSVNLYAPMKWDVVNHRDPTGELTADGDFESREECLEKASSAEGLRERCEQYPPAHQPNWVEQLGARWDEWWERNVTEPAQERAREVVERKIDELAERSTEPPELRDVVPTKVYPKRTFGRGAEKSARGLSEGAKTLAAAAITAGLGRATLRGVSLKWLKRNRPKGWRTVPSKHREGFVWLDEGGHERLRFMRPTGKNPAANKWSRQASGYFRWQDAEGRYLDADGNVVDPANPLFEELTHIIYEGLP